MKKQGLKNYIGIVIGLILSFNVGLYAWSGIQAQDGDKLSVAKWNEMTSGVWGRFGAAMHYTGGNVGIGTSAPSAKLDIQGTQNLNDSTNIAKAVNSILFVGTGSDGIGIDNNQIERTNNGNPLYINFNSTAPLLLNYGQGAGGNVGIGGNTPDYRLSIATNAGDERILKLESTGNANLSIRGGAGLHQFLRFYENTTGQWEVGNSSGDSNKFYFNPNPGGGTTGASVVIQKNGNVGIGTTIARSRLTVLENLGYGLTIGESYNAAGSMDILHNAYIGHSTQFDGAYKWLNTHPNFGSRGISFNYGLGISFYADQAASTANSNFTPTTRMVIHNNGYIGIGTTSPSQKLDIIGGNGRVESGYSWLTSSDSRYKKNITDLGPVLDKIMNLRSVRYDLKDDKNIITGSGKHIGIIAQEIEKEFPELVSIDEKGYRSVAYDKIGSVLINAIKELKSENNILKQKEEEKETRLQKLEEEIKNLKK